MRHSLITDDNIAVGRAVQSRLDEFEFRSFDHACTIAEAGNTRLFPVRDIHFAFQRCRRRGAASHDRYDVGVLDLALADGLRTEGNLLLGWKTSPETKLTNSIVRERA